MDRAMVTRHLQEAQEHVKLGLQHVSRQREIVAELERDGHDVTAAHRLLANFERMQETHEADLHRIERELANLDSKSNGNQSRGSKLIS
jgi:ribosomal 50S subunit-associated protein YjgA (DUF615 family)